MAQPGALNASATDADSPAARPHSALGEEVLAAFDYTAATLAGLAAGFGLLLLLFWSTAPWSVLVPWALLFVGLWAVRIWLSLSFRGVLRREGIADWRRWRLRWNLLTLCSAGAWGLSGWLFYQRGLGIQQTGRIGVGLGQPAQTRQLCRVQRFLPVAAGRGVMQVVQLGEVPTLGPKCTYLLKVDEPTTSGRALSQPAASEAARPRATAFVWCAMSSTVTWSVSS